jgi:hypothetical protein
MKDAMMSSLQLCSTSAKLGNDPQGRIGWVRLRKLHISILKTTFDDPKDARQKVGVEIGALRQVSVVHTAHRSQATYPRIQQA